MTDNYPPGVTGNEPEINGDADWDAFWDKVNKDVTELGMTPKDAEDVWNFAILNRNGVSFRKQNGDPVFEQSGIWWFYDETWTNVDGPFANEADARKACKEYEKRMRKKGGCP